jgi:hypothetical protein
MVTYDECALYTGDRALPHLRTRNISEALLAGLRRDYGFGEVGGDCMRRRQAEIETKATPEELQDLEIGKNILAFNI